MPLQLLPRLNTQGLHCPEQDAPACPSACTVHLLCLWATLYTPMACFPTSPRHTDSSQCQAGLKEEGGHGGLQPAEPAKIAQNHSKQESETQGGEHMARLHAVLHVAHGTVICLLPPSNPHSSPALNASVVNSQEGLARSPSDSPAADCRDTQSCLQGTGDPPALALGALARIEGGGRLTTVNDVTNIILFY